MAKSLHGEKEKITEDTIKKSMWNRMPDFKCVDSTHIFHTILSRELPPERIGGVINLKLATRRCATTEEVEDSLVCLRVIFASMKNKNQNLLIILYFFCRNTCTVLVHMKKLPTFHRCVSFPSKLKGKVTFDRFFLISMEFFSFKRAYSCGY